MWEFITDHLTSILIGWFMVALLVAMIIGRASKFGMGND